MCPSPLPHLRLTAARFARSQPFTTVTRNCPACAANPTHRAKYDAKECIDHIHKFIATWGLVAQLATPHGNIHPASHKHPACRWEGVWVCFGKKT